MRSTQGSHALLVVVFWLYLLYESILMLLNRCSPASIWGPTPVIQNLEERTLVPVPARVGFYISMSDRITTACECLC